MNRRSLKTDPDTKNLCAEGDQSGTYRHKKRGTRYKIIALGRLQIKGDGDMAPCVTYRDIDSGAVWTRLTSEFFDGRFEKIPEN